MLRYKEEEKKWVGWAELLEGGWHRKCYETNIQYNKQQQQQVTTQKNICGQESNQINLTYNREGRPRLEILLHDLRLQQYGRFDLYFLGAHVCYFEDLYRLLPIHFGDIHQQLREHKLCG